MPIVTQDQPVQAAANVKADLVSKIAGDLAGATVHLFTNNFTPTPDSLIADYTEAAYAGYAGIAVSGWTAPAYQSRGVWSTDSTNVMDFVGPAAGGGPTVYGYFVKSAGGGTPLLYGVRFANPVDTTQLPMVASFSL